MGERAQQQNSRLWSPRKDHPCWRKSGALLRGVQQAAEDIAGAQQDIDQRRRHGNLAPTNLIQQIFQAMREAGDVVESEHSAAAFDGVRGTENAVQRLRIRFTPGFEAQQAALHGFQMLPCFFKEDIPELL